jgi:hypothetical protein
MGTRETEMASKTTNETLTTTFKAGDKVREIKFGGIYTVMSQRGSLMVYVEELSNGWIHPANLRLISREPETTDIA